jgi:uncharacterized repeat protein (TIGR03803 family)
MKTDVHGLGGSDGKSLRSWWSPDSEETSKKGIIMKLKDSHTRILIALVGLSLLALAPKLHAAVFQELHGFVQSPYECVADLVEGPDGAFYGTTAKGGTNDYGTVFRANTNGMVTVLFSFADTNGAFPCAGLTLGRDGALYGTTAGTISVSQGDDGTSGGIIDPGAIFRITTNGVFTNLVYFFTNGTAPYGGLLLAGDGSFYGTTRWGGSSNLGTIFRVTTSGALTPLTSFAGTNGAEPLARLAWGPDGALYGTTVSGGDSSNGTIFRITTNGSLTSLASFNGNNGARPRGSLLLAPDGLFYGTTYSGGESNSGTVFRVSTNGNLTMRGSFIGSNEKR